MFTRVFVNGREVHVGPKQDPFVKIGDVEVAQTAPTQCDICRRQKFEREVKAVAVDAEICGLV